MSGLGDRANAQATDHNLLPLFYSKPEPLNADRHGSLRLAARATFDFARTAHAIPVAAAELPAAMRSYPIVFIGPKRALVAVTGLRREENLFVDSSGEWVRPHYVPTYIRRYPFILAHDRSRERLTLCIDRASERIVEADGIVPTAPFFQEGEPSDATKQALAFCDKFEKDLEATRKMVEQIESLGLFAQKQGRFTLPNGEILNLSDFHMIDEVAVNDLSDANFLCLRKSGALSLIFCHLASTNSWHSLLYRASQRRH